MSAADLNEAVQEVAALVRDELSKHRVPPRCDALSVRPRCTPTAFSYSTGLRQPTQSRTAPPKWVAREWYL